MPEIGTQAPDFTLKSVTGNDVSLSSFKGQKVILYFYPKDETPGCTKEACDFRDRYAEIKEHAVILGVSADDSESHKKFAEHHKLPFDLLSDTTKEMMKSYGVWKEKSMFGKKFFGIQRATFLINEEGKIVKIWPKVNVINHINEILKEIKK